MKYHRRGAAVILTAMLSITGTAQAENPNIFASTLAEQNQKTAEISTGELRQILDSGSALILDTRTRLEFDAGHIPGAVMLDGQPLEQINAVNRLVANDKSKALVLYCNGPFCQASRRLADQLVAGGFINVRRYQLGIPVWRALGGPIQIMMSGVERVLSTPERFCSV